MLDGSIGRKGDRSGVGIEPLAPTAIELDELVPRWRQGSKALRRVLGVVVAALIWEIAATIIGDPVILPSIQTTVSTLIHYMFAPYPSEGVPLWDHALVSLARIMAGFVLGTVLGISVGAAMASIRILKDLIDPIIEITRPLPPLAFIPLFIVWFGIGELSKVLLIMVGVIPIMAVATVGALDSVPVELIEAGRVLGAGRGYNLMHVRVRAALPGIVTGMRISMGVSWTSIVAVEMIAATSGVGYVILQAGSYLVTSLVFSGIIIISLLGLGLDSLLRLLLRRLGPAV
ncbi:MAG: ABC transporter permease [Actinomycetota bacterium]|nr:ABC transporter permease [Actinomycetota bacterium]